MSDFSALLAAHAQDQGHGGGHGGGGGGRRKRDRDRGDRDGGRGGGGRRDRWGDERRRRHEGRDGGRDDRHRNGPSPPRQRAPQQRSDVPWRHAWPEDKLREVRGRTLVIVPAGDGSLHDDAEFPWHGRPELDLCVIYFGKNEQRRAEFEAHSKYFFARQGPKWQLVRFALRELDWKQYEYIWLPDDDLKMDPALVVRMFRIASEHGVLLGQPALFDVNVQRQYKKILVRREDLLLHYTNFVEIMCPFFRVDALEFVAHTMDSDACKSGWGLDMLWPTMLDFRNVAVIDACPVLHTRPQNAFSVDNSFYRTYNIDPQRECHDLMRHFRFKDYRKRRFEELPLPPAPREAPAEQGQQGGGASEAPGEAEAAAAHASADKAAAAPPSSDEPPTGP